MVRDPVSLLPQHFEVPKLEKQFIKCMNEKLGSFSESFWLSSSVSLRIVYPVEESHWGVAAAGSISLEAGKLDRKDQRTVQVGAGHLQIETASSGSLHPQSSGRG